MIYLVGALIVISLVVCACSYLYVCIDEIDELDKLDKK